MSLRSLLTFLALVMSASASCCTPEKYTAHVRQASYANETFAKSYGTEYADAANGLYVTYTKYKDPKGVSSLTKTYYNMLSGDFYIVIGGRCTKGYIKIPGVRKDKPQCVPDSAKLSSFRVGGLGDTLELLRASISLHPSGLMQTTYTKKHCIPVQQRSYFHTTIGNISQVTYANLIDFYDFKPSVDDPSVFVLPDICKH